ncbi:MAG: P-loop NTPase fold protein [Pseudomonadota bacterium]
MKFGDPDDLRDLSKFAEALEAFIGRTPGTNSILIDSGWGNGKTDFSKRWQHRLTDLGYVAVRFDAFRWDLSDNPFAALTSQIYKELQNADNSGYAEDFKGHAAEIFSRLTKRGPELLLVRLAEKLAGSSATELVEIVKGQDIGVAAGFADDVEKMAGIDGAIASIQKTVNAIHASSGQPIVLIIDELDRCRPAFASGVLDVIHHFFDLENISIFVLTNSRALPSDQEGHRDFTKFFSTQVRFPSPQDIDRYGGEGTARSEFVKRFISKADIPANIQYTYFLFFTDILDINSASLRACVRSLDHLNLTQKNWEKKNTVFLVCYFLGVALKYSNYEKLKKIIEGDSAQEYLLSSLPGGEYGSATYLSKMLTEQGSGEFGFEIRRHGNFDKMFRRIVLDYVDVVDVD